MNRADDVIQLQTQLSDVSGKKKLAEWLLVAGLIILIGSVVSAIMEGSSVLRALSGSLCLISLCLGQRAAAKRRVSELEKQLS